MKRAGQFMVPDSDTYFAPFLEQGGFQLDHLQQALGFVTDFRVAVDGGAHVGSWALKMAEVFDEVIAFEPAEDTFECLNENVWKSTNVSPFCAALGAEFGRGKIVDDISRNGNTGSRFMRMDEAGSILIKPLDSFELTNLDFLKLDVEGFEYYALLGGEQTIKNCRPVIVIEEKGFGRRYDIQPFAASGLLTSWGARCVTKIGKDYVFAF